MPDSMTSIAHHVRFQHAASLSREHERRRWFIAAKQRRAKREAMEEEAEAALAELVAVATIASDMEVRAFQAKLDRYDEATVEALMLNTEQLEFVRAQIADMLDRAHVLEDGRRVFKTRDGQRVFDEHGEQVSPETVRPDQIDDKRPYWEDYEAARDHEKALTAERRDLLRFQEKLDEARERSEADDLTKDELDELEAELDEAMPASLTVRIGNDLAKSEPALPGQNPGCPPAQTSDPVPNLSP